MAKKKRQLTQAEIWDDSALQQSWDEAYEEYKLYHSIHARGERVEDVIRDAEGHVEGEEMVANGFNDSNTAAAAHTNGADPDDVEEGELEDEVHENGFEAETMPKQMSETLPVDQPAHPQPPESTGTEGQPPRIPAMPNPILANVQDEALKNLMMSWYYAGYYTGLYEGQQVAAQNQAATKTG